MTKFVYAYKSASAGAKQLAEAMGVKRIKHNNSKVNGGPGVTIFNWGAGTLPDALLARGTTIYNKPANVNQMANKLYAFQTLSKVCRMPEWTDNSKLVRQWLEAGHMVFARTQLNGHSGAGIVVMDPEHQDTWDTRANLYTKYVKKETEFRIHIVQGNVIDRQRKGLAEEFKGRADNNFLIRNLANGFVYVRNNIEVPADVETQALLAMGSSGLDYGAVDVLWNRASQKAYVLEINTAPGLTGTTPQNWARALNAMKG